MGDEEIRFMLDISSIVRIDVDGSRQWNLSSLDHVRGLMKSLENLVGEVLPGWACQIDGIADRALDEDFRAQGTFDKYEKFMKKSGFRRTVNYRQKADGLILEEARKSGAIVVSRDRFGFDRKGREDYSEHYPWLYADGRLIQPTLSSDRTTWLLVEYTGRGGSLRHLPEILVSRWPTPRTFARAFQCDPGSLVACAEVLGTVVTDFDAPLDVAGRRNLKEAVGICRQFPHRASVLRPGLARDAVIQALSDSAIEFFPVEGDVLVGDVGVEVLRATPALDDINQMIDHVLETRDSTGLAAIADNAGAVSDVTLMGHVSDLRDALSNSGVIPWTSLSAWDVRSVEWVVDALRIKGDTRVLGRIPLRTIPRLNPVLAGDAWCAVHERRRVSTERFINELIVLAPGLAPGSLRLWTHFQGELVKEIEQSFGVGVDISSVASVARTVDPGGELVKFCRVLAGSIEPVLAERSTGNGTLASGLAASYFRGYLGWTWMSESLMEELLSDAPVVQLIRDGEFSRLFTHPKMVAALSDSTDDPENVAAIRKLSSLVHVYRSVSRLRELMTGIHAIMGDNQQ